MIRFVESIRKKYLDRLLVREQQWPPVRGDKLINLQLVETDKADSFSSRTRETKRSPIHIGELFLGRSSRKPVKRVLVEGHAGIGKTTLSLMLSEGWAERKILQEFGCILLLPLREKKVSSAESLPDLLKLLHSSGRVRTTVAEELEDNEGEGLLIIADGWDELEEVKCSKDSFLYDLLFGDVVPFASVLITSRPSASSSIRNLPSVNRIIEVLGFDDDNIKAYIESEYESNPEEAFGLLKQLESNPLLQSVCSIPLNCAIACYLWRTLKQDLPSTMTDLYTQIILSVLYRDIKKIPEYSNIMSLTTFDSIPEDLQPYWWRTCEFAFDTISNNQIVFSKEELEIFLPEALTEDQKILCFGLLQSSPSLLPVGHGLSINFLHLTFQEHLAALHITTLPVEKQLEICEKHAPDLQFAMVWRFYFGFVSMRSGRQVTSQKVNASIDIAGLLSTFLFKKDKLLLCHAAFEYRDPDISSLVSALVNDRLKGSFPCAHNSLDCAAIFHVIAHTAFCPSLLLHLGGCGLGDAELNRLIKPLLNANGQLQIKKLDLTSNKLSSKGISELFTSVSVAFSQLKDLHLSGNKIDFEALSNVFSSLEHVSCHSLSQLSLSNTPLAVAGFNEIERAINAGLLPLLYKLELSNTMTTDSDVNGALLVTLTDALSHNCQRLMVLDLSKNILGKPGAQAIGRTLHQLTQRVDEFDLSVNDTQLGDRGIIAFVESFSGLCNLYYLNIQQNDIHSVGLSSIVDSLSSAKLACVVLDMNNNPLGNDGALLITKLLSNEECRVRKLHLSSCQLTTPLVNLPKSDILEQSQVSRNHYITSLGLSNITFTGEDIRCLAGLVHSCIDNIRSLATRNCQLSSSDLKLFLDLLYGLHCSRNSRQCIESNLQQWYLGDNDIDDVGVAALIDVLPQHFPCLSVVDIGGNRVSSAMKMKLTKQCGICQKVLFQRLDEKSKITKAMNVSKQYQVSPKLNSNSSSLVSQKKEDDMWNEVLTELCMLAAEMATAAPVCSSISDVESLSVVEVTQKERASSVRCATDSEVIVEDKSDQSVDSTANSESDRYCDSGTPSMHDQCTSSPLNTELPSSSTPPCTLTSREHLREVRTAVWDVRSKWRSLGLELGVDVHTLDAISVEHRDRPDDCLTHVLQQWMDSGNIKPTWERLVQALEARPVGFIQLARTLREKYTLK